LRAGYFYTNLLLSIDLIKNSGFMGNMFTIPAGTFTLVDTDDIALAAADALTKLDFKGHSYKYVVSDESGTDEIASVIGKEIGKPDLEWVRFPRPTSRKCSSTSASLTERPMTMLRCSRRSIQVCYSRTT
jgi:uncharacterized protein YbjT (DUF2867 family)